MPESPANTISLRHVWLGARRHWVAITVLTVIGLALGIAVAVVQKKEYTATATLSFNDPSIDLGLSGVAISPNIEPDKFAAAQAAQVTLPPIVNAARAMLAPSLKISETKLAADVSAVVETQSNLVDISSSRRSGAQAQRIVNAFAQATYTVVTQGQRNQYAQAAATLRARDKQLRSSNPQGSADLQASGDAIARLQFLASFAQPVDIVSTATRPTSPSTPTASRDALLGVFLGFILGCLVALAREKTSQRFRSPGEISSVLHLPLVGSIRASAMGSANARLNGEELDRDDVEAFRIVRQNVEYLNQSRPRTILVSSAKPDEGKSTVAAALAYTNALAGRLTLLVEMDLRRPTLAARLGIEGKPGLSDYLRGQCEAQDILRTVSTSSSLGSNGSGRSDTSTGFACIPAGTPGSDAAELIVSPTFRHFLREIAEVYDVVICDSSPILPVVDTLEIAPHVDAVVLCFRSDQSRYREGRAVVAALAPLEIPTIGAVLTGIPKSFSDEYGYYAHAYGATA